jgi:hypothetical protein
LSQRCYGRSGNEADRTIRLAAGFRPFVSAQKAIAAIAPLGLDRIARGVSFISAVAAAPMPIPPNDRVLERGRHNKGRLFWQLTAIE